MLSIKDQQSDNTCSQESATLQSEVREQMILSEQSLTCLAKSANAITGNGFSTLKAIQEVIKNLGIAAKSFLARERGDWERYSSLGNLLPEVKENALIHRSKSYWQIVGRDARLKFFDEAKDVKPAVLATGVDWYSGWNMNWGFSAPWIIKNAVGAKVGGHAITMVGYDLNYYGQKVYIFVNSYGSGYADGARFYISMDYFDQVGYPTYAQLDLDVDVGGFLSAYDGKYVKNSKGGIYFIENATKRPFNNWIIYLSHGGGKGMAEKISDEILNQVPNGEPIKIEETANWELVREVSQEDNLKIAQQYAKLPLN